MVASLGLLEISKFSSPLLVDVVGCLRLNVYSCQLSQYLLTSINVLVWYRNRRPAWSSSSVPLCNKTRLKIKSITQATQARTVINLLLQLPKLPPKYLVSWCCQWCKYVSNSLP